jgi:hypothetical protein
VGFISPTENKVILTQKKKKKIAALWDSNTNVTRIIIRLKK